MESACALCHDLVLNHKPHSALKKISELKGSELYKCCCCYAYLHKHHNQWEIISGGDTNGPMVMDPQVFEQQDLNDLSDIDRDKPSDLSDKHASCQAC